MSPLSLPRNLLEPWIDELLLQCRTQVMRDMLVQLRTRLTFDEQWPDQYQTGLAKGKSRVLQLEKIRTQKITMTDILSKQKDILKWWMKID